jgi:hypothetical protein
MRSGPLPVNAPLTPSAQFWVLLPIDVLKVAAGTTRGAGEGAMTPERLQEIIEHCWRVRRKSSLSAHYRDIASFLQVDPATLRRWLYGEAPIPRAVDLLFEIFAAWPEVTAERVREIIRVRDAPEGWFLVDKPG